MEGRSGEVAVAFRLDRVALAVLGTPSDRLVESAQVADLRRAGWSIGPVRRAADGDVRVEISKPFAQASGFGRIMTELAGPEGPLAGFTLARERSLGEVRYSLAGEVDLGALTGFGNAKGLPGRLRRAGVDDARLSELLDDRAGDGFRLRMTVDLPGTEEANTVAREDGDPLWVLGSGDRVTVRATSRERDLARPALLATSLFLAGLALVVWRRR
ncbi:MAG: hypothetical protein ACRDY7_05645 [Acidimicrobiia bacterium]